MTEHTEPDLTPIVPEGCDPLDDLHVVELAAASRAIGCDVIAAVAEDKNGLRWDAFQRIAFAWAKRTEPAAKIERFQTMTAQQLSAVLRLDEDDDAASDVDDDPANPTD